MPENFEGSGMPDDSCCWDVSLDGFEIGISGTGTSNSDNSDFSFENEYHDKVAFHAGNGGCLKLMSLVNQFYFILILMSFCCSFLW